MPAVAGSSASPVDTSRPTTLPCLCSSCTCRNGDLNGGDHGILRGDDLQPQKISSGFTPPG